MEEKTEVKVESPRETLERAFTQEEARTGTGASDAGGAAAPAKDQTEGGASAADAEAGKADDKAGGSVRLRGEDGKFAKSDQKVEDKAAETQEPVKPKVEAKPGEAAKPGEVKPPVVPATRERAPQSWTPAERDAWLKNDVVGIKKASLRREQEVDRTLKETADVRKNWDTVRQIVSPFEQMIRAEGSDPFRAIHSLLTTSAKLRQSAPYGKAEMIASMAAQFLGLDDGSLDLLDQALVRLKGGRPAAPVGGGGGPQEFRDSRFDAFIAEVQKTRNAREQAALARETEAWEKFKESHEFASDLEADMADLIESRHKRGVDLSYKDAYKLAVAMNPEIRALKEQQDAAEAAREGNTSLEKAKAAASSVRGTPAGPPKPPETPKDVRGALDAAFDLHEKRAAGQ